LQFTRRQAMRAAAINWNALPSISRSSWRRACKQAQLRITPFALYFYFVTKRDHAAIDTIRRNTREPLPLA
jgi:hypothetical protein